MNKVRPVEGRFFNLQRLGAIGFVVPCSAFLDRMVICWIAYSEHVDEVELSYIPKSSPLTEYCRDYEKTFMDSQSFLRGSRTSI